MKKLLEKIGGFFKSLFNGAAKAWKNASDDLKAALIKASGIINIINTNVEASPQFVLDIIKKQFPDLPIEKIKEVIKEVNKDLKIAIDETDEDLLTMLTNIQKYLLDKKKEDGKGWAKASHAGYLAIAALISPKGTKMAAIISFAEYVYHDIIKGGK